MINYNPLKNVASTAQSYLNKIFKSAPPQTPQQGNLTNSLPGMQQGIPGYNFSPYQIQKGDTFEKIAQSNNMDPSHIQSANNGMLVPPPTGSFINIPKLAQAQADYYNKPKYYDSEKFGAPITSPQMAAAGNPSGYTTNSFTGPNGQVNTAELIANIQNSPEAPTTVPAGVLSSLTINGAPATPQAMEANGYTFNQATQSWVLKGSQAALSLGGGGGNGGSAEFNNTGFMQRYNALGTPFLEQKRWDPTTHKFVSIGKLLKQGKLDLKGHFHPRGNKQNQRRHKGGQQTVVQPGPGSTSSPGTVLDLHLGSG
jgi:LysM repeat protein